jgi:lipopolysaccharide/colanic/teichoic acid biosynthesis glycosyltransferase
MKSTSQTISTALGIKETASADGVSPWCLSKSKRLFDIAVSFFLLVLVSPVMLVVALAVRLSSRGPILFRQLRVGRGGNCFSLMKFRSMVHGRQNPGLALTYQADPRITMVGRFLRRFKLDELPQFFNVLHGDMSIVGPRPDVPEYYQSLNDAQQQILLLRPGLTGAATVHFRDEEALLSRVPQFELLSFYTSTLLPQKISIDLDYLRQATFWTDLNLLLRTVTSILLPNVRERH